MHVDRFEQRFYLTKQPYGSKVGFFKLRVYVIVNG